MRNLLPCFLLIRALFGETPDEAKHAIEAAWARSLADSKIAGTTADLDRIHAYFDTPDWTSVQEGRPVRTWEDLRKYPLKELVFPFEEGRFVIDTIRLTGSTAVVTGTLKMRLKGQSQTASIPLRETWIKTDNGWRRKIHEKLIPYRAN